MRMTNPPAGDASIAHSSSITTKLKPVRWISTTQPVRTPQACRELPIIRVSCWLWAGLNAPTASTPAKITNASRIQGKSVAGQAMCLAPSMVNLFKACTKSKVSTDRISRAMSKNKHLPFWAISKLANTKEFCAPTTCLAILSNTPPPQRWKSMRLIPFPRIGIRVKCSYHLPQQIWRQTWLKEKCGSLGWRIRSTVALLVGMENWDLLIRSSKPAIPLI